MIEQLAFQLNSFLPIWFLNINCSVHFNAQEQGKSNGAFIIPKFEFLAKKQHLKVKNHHFLMGFMIGRVRTIAHSSALPPVRSAYSLLSPPLTYLLIAPELLNQKEVLVFAKI